MFENQNDATKFTVVKDFVYEFLIDVTKDGFQRSFREEQNEMTLSVLNLLELMLLFGMYQTGEEISALVTVLLEILHGTSDVTTRDEE